MKPETKRIQTPELLGAFLMGAGYDGKGGQWCLITRVNSTTVDYLCSELQTARTRDAMGKPVETTRRCFHAGCRSISALADLPAKTALDVEVENPELLADWARVTDALALQKAKDLLAGKAWAA